MKLTTLFKFKNAFDGIQKQIQSIRVSSKNISETTNQLIEDEEDSADLRILISNISDKVSQFNEILPLIKTEFENQAEIFADHNVLSQKDQNTEAFKKLIKMVDSSLINQSKFDDISATQTKIEEHLLSLETALSENENPNIGNISTTILTKNYLDERLQSFLAEFSMVISSKLTSLRDEITAMHSVLKAQDVEITKLARQLSVDHLSELIQGLPSKLENIIENKILLDSDKDIKNLCEILLRLEPILGSVQNLLKQTGKSRSSSTREIKKKIEQESKTTKPSENESQSSVVELVILLDGSDSYCNKSKFADVFVLKNKINFK